MVDDLEDEETNMEAVLSTPKQSYFARTVDVALIITVRAAKGQNMVENQTQQ